jgi:hypothetical protein
MDGKGMLDRSAMSSIKTGEEVFITGWSRVGGKGEKRQGIGGTGGKREDPPLHPTCTLFFFQLAGAPLFFKSYAVTK